MHGLPGVCDLYTFAQRKTYAAGRVLTLTSAETYSTAEFQQYLTTIMPNTLISLLLI